MSAHDEFDDCRWLLAAPGVEAPFEMRRDARQRSTVSAEGRSSPASVMVPLVLLSWRLRRRARAEISDSVSSAAGAGAGASSGEAMLEGGEDSRDGPPPKPPNASAIASAAAELISAVASRTCAPRDPDGIPSCSDDSADGTSALDGSVPDGSCPEIIGGNGVFGGCGVRGGARLPGEDVIDSAI